MLLSLDDRQRRELWGLALLALALLFALALLPVGLLGPAGLRVFPTGNVVGVVGHAISAACWGFLGVGVIGLPVLLALWGAVAFGKAEVPPAFRRTLLALGSMLLVPSAVDVFSAPEPVISPYGGWLGAAFGGGIAAGLGTVGAALVHFFLFAALCVVTLGWNPLRTLVRGGRASARGAQAIPLKVKIGDSKLQTRI